MTESKQSFFEKTDQKTFAPRICSVQVSPRDTEAAEQRRSKSFLLLFFKKEGLAYLHCLALALPLSACVIHHVTPYVPDSSISPQTADAADASTDCFEAATAAETAICASPPLTAANRAMTQALQADLRPASIFGRDAILASQRAWLLALPGQCRLQDAPGGTAGCLGSALMARTAALRAWPPAPPPAGAIAQYVSLHASAGGGKQPDPTFCTAFAQRANAALLRTGTLDPAAMGYQEVAGTYGPEAAPPVRVDLYDANVFGLFQRRARSIILGGGAPVLTDISLTQLLEAQHTANQGGRFSSFASQTGDYGQMNVFRDGARLLALAADAWGTTTPAAQGEAAHAGVWDLSGGKPVPACLFDTYTRPAEPGVFDTLPSLTHWREVLAQIRASADLPLGNAVKRDQAQLSADAEFVVLHMPLLAVQQGGGRQTLWLRERHDDVLDALFAWSARDPANKVLFDRLFALLRPAAADLVHGYQTAQALNADEARQAGGIAVMELLYQATVSIAPNLGSAPEPAPGYRPRYAIVPSPQ